LIIIVEGATIQSVKLVGDNNNYMNVRSSTRYELRCSYKTGFDDPVQSVRWYKNQQHVYTWNFGETIATALGDLGGRVAISGENLQNLKFNKNLALNLAGNYTCEVVSAKETVKSKPFPLVVLDIHKCSYITDIPSDDFLTDVNLLGDIPKEPHNDKEDLNCTLIWNFKSPAIFPRPNVTCGYYSYLHDDVVSSLPSGLTMQLLTNGSWQAGIEHIHVPISEIPRAERLGCAVSVPDTSYKRVVKFEDNFIIDHMSCPSEFLDPTYRLDFTFEGGDRNCRGDMAPLSTTEPLILDMECMGGDIAVFKNGTVLASWSAELACDATDFSWRYMMNGEMQGKVNDPANEIPMCLPNGNSGSNIPAPFFAILVAFYILGGF
ncbi:hypothetical protein Anas_03900, partial [Armadillidium nasatum]